MKHLFNLKTIMLACLLLVGMGAWAEADYTLTPSAGTNNSYTGNCDVEVGGITWNVTGNAQMVPWRIGGKSLSSVDRTVYSKTAYTSEVSRIDLTVGAASSITVNSLKLVYSTNADFSNSSEISKTFAANSTISFEGNFPANAYYKFVFNVTVSVTSNKFVEFKKVEFYNKSTGGDPDPEPTKYTVTVANDIQNGTVTANPTSAAAGATVTLSAIPNPGYEFGSWNVTNASTSAAITVTDNKFTMPAANVNVSATFNQIPTTTFASLEELVAADLTSGTEVTVSFENVPIKAFQTVSSTRKGVYFDIQKGGNDIEIYFNSAVPAEWVEGGTLSGKMTNCPWKLYSSTWELAPASGWAWTNLTYNAPAQKSITALTVSGTPTKTTYNVGDAFETAGLVVTATYSDDTQAPITTGFDWEIDYGTGNDALVAGATSVDVMAYTNDVMSEVYTVNGLTVNVPVTLTSIAVSGTPTKTEYYAGDAFETAGLVVTGTYSDSHQEVITEGVEWTVDPETLPLGATSVDVMASVGALVSDVYTVNGLSVTKAPFETVTYNFSSFTSGTAVELTNLDGFVITLAKNSGSTNPAWNATSNEARVYAGGSLTVKANNAIIKSIEYAYTVNANSKGTTPAITGVAGTTGAGTWDAETKTWTGADEEVTFSTSGSAGNIGFTKLVIKYVAGTKIETSLSWSADEAEVTIGANDNVFPTLTTTPVDLAGVTYTSSNTDVATIAADGTIALLEPGETTITASYDGDAEHAPASPASYTLTVIKAPFVPTPVAEGYESVDFRNIEPYKSTTTGGSTAMKTYEGTSFSVEFAKKEGTNNEPKYYENGKAVRAYIDNTMTITGAENIMGVNIAWASGYADDAVSITGIGTTTAVVTFSKTCRFTAITVDYRPATINITSAGYATYVAPYNLDFTGSDVTAYLVEPDVENNVVHMTSVDMVPAGTAIVVKGAEGAHNDISTVAYVAPVTTALKVSATATAYDSEYTYYYLGQENGQVGFRPLAEGGSIAAGKCFFKIAATGSARFMTIATEGETTGISAVENSKKNNAVVYNLAGQRVAPNAKGIVIVNGKKMLNK